MALHQKKVSRLNAFLVFIDESGMLMAPLVRRTWRPRGHTPILYQWTRSHKKVSVIGALCVAPDRRHLHLFFRLHPDANINGALVVDFLRNLLTQLKGPVIVIWDRLLAHRARQVQRFIHHRHRLHVFFLPPYAPELNPVENVWSYLKRNPLANMTPADVTSLARITRSHGRSLQRKQKLVRSFLKHTPLYLHLK
jgi:transposase